MTHALTYQKGHYLAFVLSENARAILLLSFHPRFSKVYAQHVTVEFKLTAEKLEAIKKQFGSRLKVTATGMCRSSVIECVTIRVNGDTRRPDGGTYHLTYSLELPKRPVDSNELLLAFGGQPQYPFDREIVLDGELELVRLHQPIDSTTGMR